MMWRSVHDDDDDEIIDGPFEVTDDDIEYLPPGTRVWFQAMLDEESVSLAEQLAERDGVSISEAVRRALRAQAASLTTAPSGAPSPRARS